MTIELFALLATGLLLLVLAMTSGALYGAQVGQLALMGNREALPTATGAAGRTKRAHQNLLENIVPFAVVILAAQALQVSTLLTEGAALTFLAARVLHAVVYILGIPMIRTLAWIAGVGSTLLIGAALL